MNKASNWQKFKSTALHYLWGAYANGFNGAVTAVYAVIGTALGSAVVPSKIPPPNWQLLVSVFVARFALDVLGYFKAHPLPETFPGGEVEKPAGDPPPVPSSPAMAINPDKPFEKAEAKS